MLFAWRRCFALRDAARLPTSAGKGGGAFLGDSITDPRQKHSICWQYLADWLNWDVHNYGVSGAIWRHFPKQIERMEREMGGDVDAIFIFMGANDYQKEFCGDKTL